MSEKDNGLRLPNYTAEMQEILHVKKPVIAMLHLQALPGEPGFNSMDQVRIKALEDLSRLQNGEVNGILIENWKSDYASPFAPPETAIGFLDIITELQSEISVPFGINVLNNDYRTSFDIASKTRASFVQLDVLVDRVVSEFSYSQYVKDHPFEVNVVPMYVFIQPKHYRMVDPNKTIEESATEAVKAGANGFIVTKATGHAPTIDLIRKVKEQVGDLVPVGIGSGFSRENAALFLPEIDFAIVGMDLKFNRITDNPVDENAVIELMTIVKEFQ